MVEDKIREELTLLFEKITDQESKLKVFFFVSNFRLLMNWF